MSQDTIIHQGAIFVRACGKPVANLDGGMMSTCMKRVSHPGLLHEDYDGRRRHEIFGPGVPVLEIPFPMHMPEQVPVTREMIKNAWAAFVEPTQVAGDEQSSDMLTVMAALRAVNEGLPIDEEVVETIKKQSPNTEVTHRAPTYLESVIIDEVDGPCQSCNNNAWTARDDGAQGQLVCNTCGSVRIDR